MPQFEISSVKDGTIYFKKSVTKRMKFSGKVIAKKTCIDQNGNPYASVSIQINGETAITKWNCFDAVVAKKIKPLQEIVGYGIYFGPFKRKLERIEVKRTGGTKMVRTELQKKMDETAGLLDIEYKIDMLTGKISETGKINRKFEGETLEKTMIPYKQQIEDIEQQLDGMQKKLKEIAEIKETDELKNFMKLQQDAAKLAQKKSLEETVAKKTEELQFHRDSYKDQTRLVNDWRNWKKRFRKEQK